MIEFELSKLYPWADVNNIIGRMSSLKIVADGKVYEGRARLEKDGANNVTLTLLETGNTDVPHPAFTKRGRK